MVILGKYLRLSVMHDDYIVVSAGKDPSIVAIEAQAEDVAQVLLVH